jgi:hypothetical protein
MDGATQTHISTTEDSMDNQNQSRYIVMTASACMPASCWGVYGRVAVVELEPGFKSKPKMISDRAIGIKRVVETWEKCNVGKTERCAFARAEAEAHELADELNAAN